MKRIIQIGDRVKYKNGNACGLVIKLLPDNESTWSFPFIMLNEINGKEEVFLDGGGDFDILFHSSYNDHWHDDPKNRGVIVEKLSDKSYVQWEDEYNGNIYCEYDRLLRLDYYMDFLERINERMG